eukprot:TRINITY_DN5082_c0_g1_i6.p1 TRINITY_DN5082_c0_g1~~TRINITY_DN5082_c0_g1_i6.p1  ORF type:complete len:265 (+),score=71.19 TRINITY_DN5082_c0_g1_i6:215-1009(+)
MFALQLSPSFRETTLELVTLRREARQTAAHYKEKEKAYHQSETSVKQCMVRINDLISTAELESAKRTDLEAEVQKVASDLKLKKKEIERMELQKTQIEQRVSQQETDLGNLKKEIEKTELMRSQEKKEYDTKTLECGTFKADVETDKVKIRELKDELARLTLEHKQVKKESTEKEESCAGLQKQMDERDEATTKLVKKVEQDDLQKLLDPGSDTGSIDKTVLETLLQSKKPRAPGVNATLTPTEPQLPTPQSVSAHEFTENATP